MAMQKIMFNDKYGLTQAVLEGRKTQTRRIITPQPTYKDNLGICWKGYAYGIGMIRPLSDYKNFISGTEHDRSCRRYRVGDIVAVAQSYGTISESKSHGPSTEKALFYCKIMKICYPKEEIPRDLEDIAGWNNKMFVKPELMPHQIRITGIRVERLQDISEEDCLKEGVIKWDAGQTDIPFYSYGNAEKPYFDTPREAYANLIDKVSGKGTWESNPYVYVYDFKLVD